jgi:ABC-type multidrug transport system fused ATPase/permease subunit
MFSGVLARYRVLSEAQKKKYIITTFVQVVLAALDLVGVTLMGVLGAIAIRGIQAKPVGADVGKVLNFLGLTNKSFQSQVLILGLLALGFLTTKSVLSLWITKKIFIFLASCSAEISRRLTKVFLKRDLAIILRRNTADYHHILGTGITNLTIGVLGIASSVVADVSLLVVVGVGVFVLDPLIALTTFILFGGVGFLLYYGLSKYARGIGADLFTFSVKSNQAISESIEMYREMHVRNQIDYFSEKISGLKQQYSNVLANQSLLPNISKYVFEVVVIFGALFVSALQFITQDSSHAIASLVVFLAAGSRIAPALLRVQQNLVLLHTNLQNSQSTLEFMKENEEQLKVLDISIQPPITRNDVPDIKFNDVTYKYPGKSVNALSSINLNFKAGTTIAIVGPSGAGKTTFVDLLLGLLTPNSGKITINGLSPKTYVYANPGSIGYVPQQVGFIDGTIKENIVITDESFSDDDILLCLKKAALSEFAVRGTEGLDYIVGEGGSRLSGGQRQRLGIARALLTKPKFLVLDEATSALDSETERGISETIDKLHGQTTLVIIAHRLSTVKNADVVVYFRHGSIAAIGTFAEVRAAVSDFDEQAALLGL